MSQSRIGSAIETVTNTAIGYVVSLVTWIVVARIYKIETSATNNLTITGIFTIVSLLRQYILRRIFNRARTKI